MNTDTYRETSIEPDEFFVDHIEEDTIPVITEIGGSVVFDETVERIDGHKGRYRVTLPAGCTYTGLSAGINPQTVILPGGRKLSIIPGQVEVLLQFQAGDSSDSTHWDGAKRIPDEEEEL